eukprot:621938_1
MEPLLHTLFVVAIYFIERTVMPFRSLHRTHTNHRREEPRSMPHSIPTSVTILYHQLVSVDLKWIQYWTSLNRLQYMIEQVQTGPDMKELLYQMCTHVHNPWADQYYYLHGGFNASWISRFKEEDERLFFGGLWPIQIQSILIRSTKQNFKKIIHSLQYLDTLLTGGEVDDEVTEDEVFIVGCLMNGLLNPNETQKHFDNYIHSTFAAFARSKKQIVLNFHELFWANQKVRDVFINTLDGRDVRLKRCKEMKRECGDLRNLWKPQIFEIFKNDKSVVVMTTFRYHSHSISMD